MRFLRRGLSGLFITGIALACLIWAGALLRGAVQDRMSQQASAPQGRERVFAVAVTTARAGTQNPVLTAFGQVQSRRSLELRAAVRGTVVELSNSFVEGGAVSAGAVLVRIDPRDAQSAVARAKTDRMDAEAEQREAARAVDLARDELAAAEDQAALRQKALERQRSLEERRVGSAANVEAAELAVSAARTAILAQRRALTQAEARVDSAVTALSRASLALEEAERMLADTVIRAEFGGLLSGVTVTDGELLSQNEKLADLVDADALEVAFQVSASQYARLLDNGALDPRPVTVLLDSGGASLRATGRITRESAAVGAGQTGRQIFAAMDAAGGLKPGDFVSVKVEEAALSGIFRLPNAALGADGTVLVLGDGDRLETVQTELLRRQGDDVLLRADGLEGREVVRQRSALLGAGIKVRPLRAGPDGQVQAAPESAPEMIELDAGRRARLIAAVEQSARLPDAQKADLRRKLEADKVPAALVQRIEARMGG